MYYPTAEQADIDRKKAYESGVPHGYVPPGDKYKGLTTITLTVLSELVGQRVGRRGRGQGKNGARLPNGRAPCRHNRACILGCTFY